MAVPKPFDASAEASKLYDLSKSTDPKAFQHELDSLRQNPAHYNETVKAMETKEAARELTYNRQESASLHELKIVRSSPNGPVSKIVAQDVSKENQVEKTGLPKFTLYDSATDATPHGSGKGTEDAGTIAKRAEQERQETARKETARIKTEATTLLTDLQNHDDKDFGDRYNKLSDADKVAVGKQIQTTEIQERDLTLHILSNPDGSIKTVERAGKLEYITPGEFLNEAYDKNRSVALKDYCASLSPEDRAAFFANLQAEQAKHSVTVETDDKGNEVIKGLNGKKIWDSKPESGFGKILHQTQGVVVHPNHY